MWAWVGSAECSCGNVWQVCTLGHTCTGGCICTLEKDAWGFDVRVNEQCPEAGHTAVVFSAEYSPDGMRIVSGSHDGLVIIWDAANGAEVCNFVR